MAVRKIIAFILVLTSLCLAHPVRADVTLSAPLSPDIMMRLPVMHDGRIKPMGRAAQIIVKRLGDTDLSRAQATGLLMHALFVPEDANKAPLFRVSNAATRHVLKLEKRPTPYYSFRELNAAFVAQQDLLTALRAIPATQIDGTQQDFLDLYARVTYFEQLTSSMTLFLPLRDKDTSILRLKDAARVPALQGALAQGAHSQEFRIIPHRDGTTWRAPWQVYNDPSRSAEEDTLLTLWDKAAHAYIAQDRTVWQETLPQLYDNATDPALRKRLEIELAYLDIDPDFISLVGYAVAFFFAVFATRRAHMPWLRRLAMIGLGGGLVLHGASLTMRMMILQRPPVSDLYESFIFVGFILVSAGFVYILRTRDTLVLAFTALLATLLQLFSFSIHPEFDSLKVLQAVLDTQFWLATHVVLITGGYACCLLTSILAHAQIVTRLWFPNNTRIRSDVLYRRSYALSLLSLFLMVSGTTLGGIWADQSWGRFWGWDPKENGALLIILWLVWLLHGKVSGHIRDGAFMLGLAGLSLLVALSWIGTNMLGVGLHAYGFIDSVALGMLVMIGLEALFLVYIGYRGKRHAS